MVIIMNNINRYKCWDTQCLLQDSSSSFSCLFTIPGVSAARHRRNPHWQYSVVGWNSYRVTPGLLEVLAAECEAEMTALAGFLHPHQWCPSCSDDDKDADNNIKSDIECNYLAINIIKSIIKISTLLKIWTKK